MVKHSDPTRRAREAEREATEVVGRRLVNLDRLYAYLRNKAAQARENADDEYHDLVDGQAHALGWALPILRNQVEIEVAAAIEREERRKKWGVHHLPDAVPMDPDHARAITHARSLRVELEKMKLRVPAGDHTLADMYARFLDAVIASVEEHAQGYYWDQVTTPVRMVLRNDGAIVLDSQQ
jgi:hypothetical protein